MAPLKFVNQVVMRKQNMMMMIHESPVVSDRSITADIVHLLIWDEAANHLRNPTLSLFACQLLAVIQQKLCDSNF